MDIEKKKPKRTNRERTNAEFKSLRKRIERLEKLVLTNKIDNGLVNEPVKKNIKKG